jgi:hypothetical protein
VKIPFLNRFIVKTRSAFEMEEITDKTLREFLRCPWEDEEQMGDAIYGDSSKIVLVTEQMRRTIPVFCRVSGAIHNEQDDVKISGKEGVILPYVKELREIIMRQMPDEDQTDENNCQRGVQKK